MKRETQVKCKQKMCVISVRLKQYTARKVLVDCDWCMVCCFIRDTHLKSFSQDVSEQLFRKESAKVHFALIKNIYIYIYDKIYMLNHFTASVFEEQVKKNPYRAEDTWSVGSDQLSCGLILHRIKWSWNWGWKCGFQTCCRSGISSISWKNNVFSASC